MNPRHFLALISLSLPAVSSAASLALELPAVVPITYYASDPGTFGWILNVEDPVDVVGLGWWDFGADGLVESHEIGLWRNNGTALTSAYVPAGEVAPLLSGFRMVKVARIRLDAGLYRIGGTSGVETDALAAIAPMDPAPVMYPGLTFAAAAMVDGADLNFPSLGQEFMGYFGPTLLVERTPAAVDDTGASGLLLLLPLTFAAIYQTRSAAARWRMIRPAP